MARLFSWAGFFIIVAAFCPLATPAADTKTPDLDWPKFRGPHGDGISSATGLLKEWPPGGPPLVGQSQSVGRGFSSVTVAGKRIFTMGDEKGSSWIFALDRATGKKEWSAQVGKSGGNNAGTRCTPTVDGGLVYGVGQFG